MVRTARRVRLLIVRHGETDCNVQGIIQGQLDTDLNAVGRSQAEYVAEALSKEHIDEVYSSPLRRAKDTADAIVRRHPRYRQGQASSSSSLPYYTDDRIKERGFGAIEGKKFDRSKPKRDSMDGIEQMNPFIARLADFLGDILSSDKLSSAAPYTKQAVPSGESNVNKEIDDRPSSTPQASVNGSASPHTILLVSHGAAISALVGALLMDMGLATISAGLQRTRIWNCSITEVSVDLDRLAVAHEGRIDLLQMIHEEQSGRPFIVERWADVRHLPADIDDATTNTGNADEMVGKAAA